MPRVSRLLFVLPLVAFLSLASAQDEAKPAKKEQSKPKKQKPIPYTSGIKWDEPEHVHPGMSVTDPPSDAVVLFDGTNLDAWDGDTAKWDLRHTYGISGGRIKTKQAFGDCQLHLEFRCPASEYDKEGQGRGNNGVGLMDAKYEVQILDSHSNVTYFDGQAAAVYKQLPPMVNASLPTGQWQRYDIFFKAPRFNDDGSLKSPANITVLHNGVLVQWNYDLKGDTPFMVPPSYKKHAEKLPLVLYYHNDPVEFRNIWIRDLAGDAGIAQLAKEEPAMKEPAEKPAK